MGAAFLTAAYYGAAHLGYAFDFSGPVAAIIWLPAGVGIAFLYLYGLRYWPGVAIGDLLVNNYSTLPVGSAIGQSCGNLLEVLVAAALLRRLSPNRSPLATITGLAGLLGAIALGTCLSATVGAVSLGVGDVVSAAEAPHVWRTWWLGDASGALVIVPLAIAWHRPPRLHSVTGPRLLEAALLLGAVVAVCEVALHTDRPLAYLVFPGLVWAGLRFGARGATLALLIAAGFAIWGTTHFVGPFSFQSITHSVLSTQLYIAVASVMALAVAALVSERDELEGSVRVSRARLVEAGDTERRRLERDLHDGAQQRLVALSVRLGFARQQARDEPGQELPLLEAAEDELLLAIEDLRELAHGIHPVGLHEFGLARAVQAAIASSPTAIEVVALPRERLDDTAEATAYYTILESITNAQKHARASLVRVSARLENGSLLVEVGDDGVGGATERGGLGLLGLRDRVEAVGGDLTVVSEPGAGTIVAAVIPATAVVR